MRDSAKFVVISVLVALAHFAGFWASNQTFTRQIIDRGAAYYHPETGDFTWRSGNVFMKEVSE